MILSRVSREGVVKDLHNRCTFVVKAGSEQWQVAQAGVGLTSHGRRNMTEDMIQPMKVFYLFH